MISHGLCTDLERRIDLDSFEGLERGFRDALDMADDEQRRELITGLATCWMFLSQEDFKDAEFDDIGW